MSTQGSLPFCDGFFGFAFCYSVFTHMDEAFTYWLQELRRVIRPNGCLLVTVHDEAAVEAARSIATRIAEISSPDFVLNKLDNAFGGHNNSYNVLNAYIRRDVLLKLISKSFEVDKIVERTMGNFQTAYLLRRRPHV